MGDPGVVSQSTINRRYAMLLEGQCPSPYDHGTLERRGDHGWCDQCQMGWMVRGTEVTAIFWNGARLSDMASLVEALS